MELTKLNEIKNAAKSLLSYQRLQLLNKHPFIGHIAMNLDLVPIRDARCNTAMTDGNTIFFDIDFLSRLTPDEVQFVLGHEIWHVVMLHFLRKENREHTFFNVAADMEVNQILDNDGFISPSEVIFPNNKHSRKCEYSFEDGLSAEEYYDLLVKYYQKKQQNESNFENNSENSPSSSSIPNNEKNQKKSQSSKKNGKKCEGQFDKHFDNNEDLEEALNEAMKNGAEDKYGTKGADSEFTPRNFKNENEAKEASEKVREMVVASVQNYERTRGTLPAHIKKYVNSLLDSKLPWRELLASFITSGFANKTNWNSPNRRFAYNGLYLPSHDGEKLKIAIGIDTSASCSDMCEKFLSEVVGITKNFDSYELHLLQCDTEVKKYDLYDENNLLDPNDKIEFYGFGGTKLHPIFDFLDLNDTDVDLAIIFTDGECENFSEEDNIKVPVLWAITGNNSADNLNIGQKINIVD